MRTRPEVPSSGMVFRRNSGKAKAFCATARCGIPVCLRIPFRPTVTARPLPSPRPFFSRSPNQPIGFLPLCGNMPVPPFAHEGCRRRPQAPARALVPLPPPRARSESVARSLPESALRCLTGTRCTRRRGYADTAGTHALPPCSPSTAPGDRSGMAARGAAIQSHGPE